MQIGLFKITSILLLFNAFLVSSKLPDGLFTAKEVGLYFAVGLSCLLTALMCFRNRPANVFKLKVIDILVFGYLFVLPFFHLMFFAPLNVGAIMVHGAYGFVYLTLRVLTNDLKPVELVNALSEIMVVIFCFQLLIGIAQYANFMPSYYSIYGATGMFFNPGPFAIFISSLSTFVYILGLIKLLNRQYKWLGFYTSLLIISVYFVILSLSRSAWIGLFVSVFFSSLVILIVNYEHFFKANKTLVKVGALMFLIVLIPISFFLYEMKVDSANGRKLVWKATGLMINDSWQKGVGIGNFAPNYVHYQASYFNRSHRNVEEYGQLAGDSRYAFNDLLHTFAESGIIGILLFLSILSYLFFTTIRFMRLYKAKHGQTLLICGGMAPIIVILVAGLTAYPLQMIPISILFWFLVAVVVSVHPPIRLYNLKSGRNLLLGLTLVFFSGFYLYYAKAKTHAYMHWAGEEKKEIKDMDLLLSIYPLLKTSGNYLSTIANEYIDQNEYEKAIVYLQRAVQYSPSKELYYTLGKCYEKKGDILQAEKHYVLVQQAIPNLLRPYYLIAMMNFNNGDIKTFKVKAQEALEFKPKINNVETMEMKRELKDLLAQIDL